MTRQPIVSDLVLAVLNASSEALSQHFARVLAEAGDPAGVLRVSERLARGEQVKLLDAPSGEGFAHAATSGVFYRYLSPLLRGQREGRRAPRGVDRHIWAADYDRRVRSLFPTGQAAAGAHDELEGQEAVSGRTRVSALVQQALLYNSRILQMEKATTGLSPIDRGSARMFAPSPYYVAKRILTDPDAPTSEIYARAAMRADLMFRLQQRGVEVSLTYDTVAAALDGIAARAMTSKSARRARDESRGRGEALFLRNYLAALGLMALEIEWDADRTEGRIDDLLARPDNLLNTPRAHAARIGFRLHPDHAELPDASELLNELQGLPLPLEGAATVFHGGLRFATQGDIVASISGPFGAGKTSACLSLAAALAPMGCRTLFLSCEEGPDDIGARLSEASPSHMTRSTPLFRKAHLADMRDVGPTSPWFRAHKLRLQEKPTQYGEDRAPVDVANELMRLLDEALETAPHFAPFRDLEESQDLPSFARRIIIVDGFHQLFRESSADGRAIEQSLRRLVDRCREQSAVFIFTVAEDEPAMQRMDYLCDLVLQLDRTGFDRPDERATRLFRLLKARRQPARTGVHIMHLAGSKGLRVKPNVASHADRSKRLRWMDPDARRQIQLGDTWDELRVQDRSQTLIYGKGSSGKAGLGLYILHRRPLPFRRDRGQSPHVDLFEDDELDLDDAAASPAVPGAYEARTLVISFLYQAPYYRHLARRLRTAPKRGPKTVAHQSLPDRALVDVIGLYPGGLTPEDFLAKIDNQMIAAELRGLPYTGVLVDGIHNVFVQYPALQNDTAFWPQLYNMLRRRGVTVVTTHTEFELREAGVHARSLSVDFEHAQRKAAPLLSVLVSAADYVFELSAENTISNAWEYRLMARSTLGEDPPSGYVIWNRQSCRLGDFQAALKLDPTGERR